MAQQPSASGDAEGTARLYLGFPQVSGPCLEEGQRTVDLRIPGRVRLTTFDQRGEAPAARGDVTEVPEGAGARAARDEVEARPRREAEDVRQLRGVEGVEQLERGIGVADGGPRRRSPPHPHRTQRLDGYRFSGREPRAVEIAECLFGAVRVAEERVEVGVAHEQIVAAGATAARDGTEPVRQGAISPASNAWRPERSIRETSSCQSPASMR